MIKLLLIIFFGLLKSQDLFLGEDQVSGIIPLNKNDDLFFWLFRSRNNKDQAPLVIWLTGGPGCASELAIFYENGPFSVNDDLTLKKNDFSWNNQANLLFVDQPVGTGYSKGRAIDYVYNEEQIANDFYLFLINFYEKFPEFKSKKFLFQERPLYITGESYAGHYIPVISAYVHQQQHPDIIVKGFAIGNGWTDPYLQYPQYNTFAKENNLISSIQSKLLDAGFSGCQGLIKSGIWPVALEFCQILVTTILGVPFAPNFNVYDIRKKCDYPPLCYNFDNMERYLQKDEVIQALGVRGRSWQSCNMIVHTFLLGDWLTDQAFKVKYLLENGVKGLVYSGDKDFICNWRGGEAWTNGLNWEKQHDFQQAQYQDWLLDGVPAGQLKQAGDLTFLRIYDAGHMVPMDQPNAALKMLNDFIQ